MYKLIILFLLVSCIFTKSSPESLALSFVESRYFSPKEAYEMTSKTISYQDFMREHEQMQRLKDYQLEKIIKFKVKKTTTLNESEKEVTIEVTRPDIQKIFSGFYLEKISTQETNKDNIKRIVKQRLHDPKAPTENIDYTITIKKTNSEWKVTDY